jgi:MFS family permease
MISDKEEKRVHLSGHNDIKKTPIYALFTANIISYIGNTLTLLAIPWFVLQTTGSVTQAGITGFFSALPLVLSGFLGSALVDRLGFRRASVIGDMLSGMTVLCVPLLYHTIGLAFWQLLVLVFISGLLQPPAATARGAIVPELAERARMPLERANALDDGISRVARFLGAPLAGILIVVIGTSNLLWLDAASFALSALIIALFVPPIASRRISEDQEATQQYLSLLRAGFQFVLGDVVLLTITLVVLVTNLLDAANFSVVEPAYILQTYHSAVFFGLLVAATGGAAFVGAITFAIVGHRVPRQLTFGLCFIIGGALRFWVLLIPNFPVVLTWFTLSGLAIGPLNALISTVLQERTPLAMRTRVLGISNALANAGMPLGTFAAGFVVTWIGIHWTLVTMGAIYLLATLSILLNPALKAMERSK